MSQTDRADNWPGIDRAAKQLASLDDCLGGHCRPSGRSSGDDAADHASTVSPADVDLLLLLNQAGAEHRLSLGRQALPIPTTLGRFSLVREVGCGGFATVYEAIDTRLRRRVALKIAHPETSLSLNEHRRFIREAELAARVVHPHVVTIHEVGDDEGKVYIAQEFCDGGSLKEWLDDHPGPVSPRTAATVVRAIAEGLHNAHRCGVTHRDIKPANVMLTTATTTPILPGDDHDGFDVKLGDFGLGKLADGVSSGQQLTQLSAVGSRVGTLAWMAPEQANHSLGPIGPRADIYALGLILDRMLTGRCLQDGRSDTETLRMILLVEPIAADRVVPSVPADLAAVCLKCLAKAPHDRYASAAELAVDLSRFLDNRPTIARPLSPVGRAVRAARRQPLLSASIATAAVAAAVGAFLWNDLAGKRTEIELRKLELLRHEAAGEMRLAYDFWENGSVSGAIEHLRACRTIDPQLADSSAGRWLLQRIHGESSVLLDVTEELVDAEMQRPRDIHVVAVSPDGGMMAAGRADGTLSLARRNDDGGISDWLHVPGHDEINDVAFSPDGALVATAGQDGAVHVWATDDGRLVATPSAMGPPLYAVVFSPDGARLAWGGEQRTLFIGSPAGVVEPRALRPFDGVVPASDPGEGDIESILWREADHLFASCGKHVAFVRESDGAIEREFNTAGWGGVMSCLAVSPDGRRLICSGSDSEPRIFDIATGDVVTVLPRHPHWVQGCAFSPDGRSVVTGCKDGVIREFDVTTDEMLRTFIGHEDRVWDVCFEREGVFISAGKDGTLRRWSTRSSSTCAGAVELRPPAAAIAAARIAPAGVFPSATFRDPDDSRIAILAPATGHPLVLSLPSGHWSLASEINLEGGVSMAVDGARSRVAVEDRRILSVFEPSSSMPAVHVSDGVSAVEWLADGRLVVGRVDGEIVMYDTAVAVATRIDRFPYIVDAIDVSDAGRGSLAIGAGSELRTYDVPASGAPSRRSRESLVTIRVPAVRIMAVAWSPDGSRIAYGTSSGSIHVVDAVSGAPRGTFAKHVKAIRTLRWSRDGRILFSCDADSVRISDVETTTVLNDLRPDWEIAAIDLTTDGMKTRDEGLLVVGSARHRTRRDPDVARVLWFDLTRHLDR